MFCVQGLLNLMKAYLWLLVSLLLNGSLWRPTPDTVKSCTMYVPLDHQAWAISSTLWKGCLINYSHFQQHKLHMFLIPYINISANTTPPYIFFSLPPPSGHFVYINHTVTLRSPKMASVSTYSKQTFPLPIYESPGCCCLRVKCHLKASDKRHKVSITDTTLLVLLVGLYT